MWIEKPIALYLATAPRMIAAAKERDVRLFVGHQRRYGLPFELFQEAATKIGTVLYVQIEQPMLNVLDFGPHLVVTALYALGPDAELLSIFGAVDWSEPMEWQGIPSRDAAHWIRPHEWRHAHSH